MEESSCSHCHGKELSDKFGIGQPKSGQAGVKIRPMAGEPILFNYRVNENLKAKRSPDSSLRLGKSCWD